MQSLWLILQLLTCLALGFLLAHRLPEWLKRLSFKVLPFFSYILLFAIAFEFAQIIENISSLQLILKNALILSVSTTFACFLCCYFIFKSVGYTTTQNKVSFNLFIHSLRSISYACIILGLGYLSASLLHSLGSGLEMNSWYFLLIFMYLIGLDLAHSPLDRSWLNWKIFLVPIAAIIGSLVGACLSMLWIDNIALKDLIMLSQGYGFYSMTGIVVTELKNAELGSIALMNDLFREMIAILLMYSLGWKYPRSAIASAGATSMDATLPMIKQSCGNTFIPHAMVSGFILSIYAPVAVSVLALL